MVITGQIFLAVLHLYFFRSSCINYFKLLKSTHMPLQCPCNMPVLLMHVAERSRLALSELTFSHQKMWLQAGRQDGSAG